VITHIISDSSIIPDSVAHWLSLWGNQVTEKQIRRGVFSSAADLEEKIMQFIDTHIEDTKPFVWTKPVEEIMAKINRARLALSNA
jgi:hypothetical protein